MIGTVTAVIRDRKDGDVVKRGGYGFICDEQNAERFFHAHNLRGTSFDKLKEGSKVEFKPITVGGKGNGLRCEDVTVIA